MHSPDAAKDAYALELVDRIDKRVATDLAPPWIEIKTEYDANYHQIWIWVLIADLHGAKASYEWLTSHARILEIDEDRCELNLMIMCRLSDGRIGHIADLCGRQDIIDFRNTELREDNIRIGRATDADIFSLR